MPDRVVSDLRSRLSDAAVILDEFEERHRRPLVRFRYLRDPGAQDAIDRIGGHPGPVTIITGAGASVEADLPAWRELVSEVLRSSRPRLKPSVRDRWNEAVIAESLTTGAAVARAHAADQAEFRDRVERALYRGGRSQDFSPGAITRQVAWWKRQFGRDVRLATFNYDDLLERALEPHMPVKGVFADVSEPRGEAVVHHLHGRINDADCDLDFVLTEDDYARSSLRPSWQDKVMKRALTDTMCVFVGLSLTDPNLTRWIHRSAATSGPDRIALFSRQGSPRLAPEVRRELEQSTKLRWEQAGVRVAFTDFFGELAQVLHEAALVRGKSALRGFRERARSNREKVQSLVMPAGTARFPDAQAEAANWLGDIVAGVRDIARSNGVRFRDEQLGAGLWIADHERGDLLLAATSDRAMTDRASLRPVPMELVSRWIAVEAVTRGAAVEEDPDVYASRWRYVRALPLVVSEGSDGRVLVGAVTLASTRQLQRSALSRVREEVRDEMDELIVSRAMRAFA